jgi:hypothetical protein
MTEKIRQQTTGELRTKVLGQDRPAWTGQPEKDSWNRTAREDREDNKLGQEKEKRTART